MFSEKDFERLWFLYKTEGEPNGVSKTLQGSGKSVATLFKGTRCHLRIS